MGGDGAGESMSGKSAEGWRYIVYDETDYVDFANSATCTRLEGFVVGTLYRIRCGHRAFPNFLSLEESNYAILYSHL